MAASIVFDKKQRSWVGEALETAEFLAERYFQVDLADFERFPYDLQTLAHLKGQEKTRRALAQVCKYEYRKKDPALEQSGGEFYRICLQDDKIIQTLRSEGPALLRPLLLYVITHEIIHVVRFSLDPLKFHLNFKEKKIEERDVHRTTYEILKSFSDPKVEVLLEHYRPWWAERAEALPARADS